MYGSILRKVFLLYLNARYGNKHWYNYYQELKESQWWSFDKITALQLERLKALLKHAYQNVPYYKQKFAELGLHPDDIKSLDDLAKLPILTRKDAKENRSELVAVNFSKNQLVPLATSGSTGEPLQLCVFRTVYLDAYNMSEKQMERFARKLCQFKPKMITAYASAAYLLARYLKHRGIENLRPGAVVSQAHKLFSEHKRLIREVFNCEVFDFYGSIEVLSMAAECPEHTGYHILTPNVILEFIRDNRPVSPGEVGKIVVTDLHNYAMPFIRYENGDLGVPLNERCPCGRGLPLLKEITGRISDMIIGSGGKYTSGHFFINFFRFKPWIKQFQVRQDINRNVTISIVPGAEPEERDLETVRATIQKELGEEIKVDILLVKSIHTTKSGKYRFTISEAPSPF